MPVEFATYMKYCRRLKYSEEPDYDKLRMLFRQCYQTNHFSNDSVFDWTPTPQNIILPQNTQVQCSPIQFTLTPRYTPPLIPTPQFSLPLPEKILSHSAPEMENMIQHAAGGPQKRKAQYLEDSTRTKRAKFSHVTQKHTNSNDEEVSVVVISSSDDN